MDVFAYTLSDTGHLIVSYNPLLTVNQETMSGYDHPDTHTQELIKQ